MIMAFDILLYSTSKWFCFFGGFGKIIDGFEE